MTKGQGGRHSVRHSVTPRALCLPAATESGQTFPDPLGTLLTFLIPCSKLQALLSVNHDTSTVLAMLGALPSPSALGNHAVHVLPSSYAKCRTLATSAAIDSTETSHFVYRDDLIYFCSKLRKGSGKKSWRQTDGRKLNRPLLDIFLLSR